VRPTSGIVHDQPSLADPLRGSRVIGASIELDGLLSQIIGVLTRTQL
jgi:hypothetical protein